MYKNARGKGKTCLYYECYQCDSDIFKEIEVFDLGAEGRLKGGWNSSFLALNILFLFLF